MVSSLTGEDTLCNSGSFSCSWAGTVVSFTSSFLTSFIVSTLAVDSPDINGEFGVVVVDEMEKISIALESESNAALLRFSESFIGSAASSFSAASFSVVRTPLALAISTIGSVG
ncbi:hypothetical protein OGAPHI_006707 [Ogataea philodendri]|uniref:Uncharacterized protein n=1 Tax=Ogataea philodendri TaxID=1378263 RepID=A0A9P8NXG3_9ASCO|nr:uncharacterized protein OGAPHI_006707 [Ogataea philodendri]KAH3661300.1 hypothetical protein OGAPHI_006707 [Ogataea philodendri]